MKIKSFITIFTLIVLFIGGVIGVQEWLDRNYAAAEDFYRLEQRFDYKALTDQIEAAQNRVWIIKDRFGETTAKYPLTVKEELRKTYEDLLNLKVKKKILEDRMVK